METVTEAARPVLRLGRLRRRAARRRAARPRRRPSAPLSAASPQCPYGGTQPTTTTVTQVELCTNGTLADQGSQVSTTVDNGNPTCNAPAACGSTSSGSTVTETVSTISGSIAATTAQCAYGGTQPTTTTVTQVELCTNGTLADQGSSVSTTVDNGNPACNAA